jgi:hypothetical protein
MLFAANHEIGVKNLSVRKLTANVDQASARVEVEISVVADRTGKPDEAFGRMNRAVHMVRRNGVWVIGRE